MLQNGEELMGFFLVVVGGKNGKGKGMAARRGRSSSSAWWGVGEKSGVAAFYRQAGNVGVGHVVGPGLAAKHCNAGVVRG